MPLYTPSLRRSAKRLDADRGYLPVSKSVMIGSSDSGASLADGFCHRELFAAVPSACF
ncbi:hypothetical protein [Sphingomonas sp. PP-F2F-G114-C0414]|uniref:hypothetical protein n=1 Tax=Sphingomonas sp. PP-F2F-G114-C0414 TaxID=2135662 RepID=UPI0016055691|nr:hypothetical protein [Sphingomonas sp. PP-F2F-G114-C0414]